MKIGGTKQLIARGAVTRLMRSIRRCRSKQDIDLTVAEADAIRRDLEATARRLKRLVNGQKKSDAWSRAETKRLFDNRRFHTAVSLIQSVQDEKVLTREEARHLADMVADHTVKENVHYLAIEKGNGGKRIVTKHGPIQSVRNKALALIVEAVSGPYEYEFCQHGRGGIEAAIKRIGDSLSQGYRFWVTCDLVNAYPSVKFDHVKEIIPVHDQLMKSVGFPHYSTSKTSNKEWGRPGLAEGASHSSKILSALTDGVLRRLDGDIRVLCYADNVAIGAHTLAEAKCALNTFKNAMTAFKAGPINLHQITICDGHNHHGHEMKHDVRHRNGVDFCQYRVSFDRTDQTIRYRPNTGAFVRAKIRGFDRLPGLKSSSDRKEVIDDYLENWANSFGLWKRTTDTEECLTQTRDRWLYQYENGKTVDAA